MSIIREVLEGEKEKYQKVVFHITQSWEWGEFREKTGVKVIRLGEFQKTKLISGWQIFFHKVPHTNYTVGYLPKTPPPNQQIFEALTQLGQKNNSLFIRLEPNLPQPPQIPPVPQFLKKSKPILPNHTFLLNLALSEEEILKKMHEKTRYNIKLAQKQQIVVKEQNENSLEDFTKLLSETQQRQGFYTHSDNYFHQQWQTLKPAGLVYLLIAYFENQPLSGIWLLRFKDQFYYAYGGSSELHREKMPNYLLHWEAIKLGKKLGCQTYDFWGAYLEKPELSDPWYGIYRFKAGFGGELVNFIGAYDLVLQPKLYKLYNIADYLRWKFLKVKRVFNKIS